MQETIDIKGALSATLERKKRRSPVHVNRISQLDDPCLRRLYYLRHDWDKAASVDDGLQGLFETGNLLEPVIERLVSEIGTACNPPWRIVGSQTPTRDELLREYEISGTIDGFLQTRTGENDGWETAGVVDIKTCSPNVYPSLTDYPSLARYPWTRRWRGQLMLYALAHDQGRCFLLLVNKTNLYDMRLVGFDLDMDYCDKLLSKAQAVNEALQAEVAPDGINDPDQCPRCQFYGFCAPSLASRGNLVITENMELEEILDRLDEMSPTIGEYKDLEKRRDALLVKGQDLACGRWLILWEERTVHRKAQEARIDTHWRKKILRSGP